MSGARKAALVGAIAVAVVALVLWRLDPAAGARADARRARDQRSGATDALRNRLDRATRLLVLAERRDSIMRLLAGREWPAESLLVLADPGLPAWRVRAIVRQMRPQWASVQPVTPRLRAALALVTDTSMAFHGVVRTGDRRWQQILPEAIDGRTCVMVRAIGWTDLSQQEQARLQLEWHEDSLGTATAGNPSGRQRREIARENRQLGPCGFLAAFGPPGTAVRQWLDSTSWLGAVKANWLEGEGGLARNVMFYNQSAREPALGVAVKQMFEPPPGWQGRTCAAPEPGACRRFLQTRFGSALDRSAPELLPGGRFIPEQSGYVQTDERAFDDPRSRFLADLVRTGGRDRFLHFWRANGTLPETYEAIYGVPADVAWQQWALESIGGPMTMGPTFSLEGELAALGLVLVAIASGIASFSRRQSR